MEDIIASLDDIQAKLYWLKEMINSGKGNHDDTDDIIDTMFCDLTLLEAICAEKRK